MVVTIFEPNPAFGGGSERVCLDLALGLHRRGHAVGLVYAENGSMLTEYRHFVSHLVACPLRPFGWRTLRQSVVCIFRTISILTKLRCDVIVSSHLHYLPFLAMVQRITKIPVLFHLGLEATRHRGLWRWAYRNLAAGVTPSEHTRRTWLKSGWPLKTLRVVPNWVDIQRFRPVSDRLNAKMHLGFSTGSPTVIYLGRVVPEKGVEILVDAMGLLHNRCPEVKLFIIGKSDVAMIQALELRAKIAGIPRDVIQFRNVVENPETYLAAADIAVMPSVWLEPYGLAALEAMACGTPVIVSKVGILPDLLGELFADYIVEPGNPNHLAECLFKVLKGGTKNPPAYIWRKRVTEICNEDMALDCYEKILQSIVSKRTSIL